MLTSFHLPFVDQALIVPPICAEFLGNRNWFFWASDFKPTLVFRLLQIKEEVRTWECWPAAYSGALKKGGLVKFTSFARTDCLRLQKYLDWLHSQNLLKLFARWANSLGWNLGKKSTVLSTLMTLINWIWSFF